MRSPSPTSTFPIFVSPSRTSALVAGEAEGEGEDGVAVPGEVGDALTWLATIGSVVLPSSAAPHPAANTPNASTPA
ncbi:hypothetical protein GCM10009525_03050 [Streptosporangium amethystogenes subsp. fukuiense]